MVVPADNPITAAKIQLGKKLFFETGLSSDSSVACASCHGPRLAFADGVALSKGAEGQTAERNSPTLFNVAFHPHLMREGGPKTLELQVLAPLENPLEMNMPVRVACSRLNADTGYVRLFQLAFGDSATPFTLTRALATFERTLISAGSPYDSFLTGDTSALSLSARRGYRLFHSQRTNCSTCHAGPLLSHFGFENNGLYADYSDGGLFKLTLNDSDVGKFKVPSLRNVAATPPYMFDGSLPTLQAVLEHYNRGGNGHSLQSPLVKPLGLTEIELKDLETFLRALDEPNARF